MCEQKRLLDIALAENAAELKRARRKAQAHEKAALRAWQLPPPLRRAALIAYALAGYRVEPAAKLLAANGRKRHWPDKTQGELFALVEALFLGVDEAELAGLADTEHPEDGGLCGLHFLTWRSGVSSCGRRVLTRTKASRRALRLSCSS